MSKPHYNENQRIPSDRDLLNALLIAIATHPIVNEVEIYFPNAPIDQRKPVKIEKLRTYGGKELISEKLTLSLYPASTSLGSSTKTSFLLGNTQTFGHTGADETSDRFNATFHLQLQIRSPLFNKPVEVKYYGLNNKPESWRPSDDLLFKKGPDLYEADYNTFPTEASIEFFVLPAEEVLKEWITVLRYVIRDIRELKPFQIRNPQITEVSYESAEIFDPSVTENLVFHRATIQFEIMFSEGCFDR